MPLYWNICLTWDNFSIVIVALNRPISNKDITLDIVKLMAV